MVISGNQVTRTNRQSIISTVSIAQGVTSAEFIYEMFESSYMMHLRFEWLWQSFHQLSHIRCQAHSHAMDANQSETIYLFRVKLDM